MLSSFIVSGRTTEASVVCLTSVLYGTWERRNTKLKDLSSFLLRTMAEARSSWPANQGNRLSASQLLPTGYKVVTQGTAGVLAAQATSDFAALWLRATALTGMSRAVMKSGEDAAQSGDACFAGDAAGPSLAGAASLCPAPSAPEASLLFGGGEALPFRCLWHDCVRRTSPTFPLFAYLDKQPCFIKVWAFRSLRCLSWRPPGYSALETSRAQTWVFTDSFRLLNGGFWFWKAFVSSKVLHASPLSVELAIKRQSTVNPLCKGFKSCSMQISELLQSILSRKEICVSPARSAGWVGGYPSASEHWAAQRVQRKRNSDADQRYAFQVLQTNIFLSFTQFQILKFLLRKSWTFHLRPRQVLFAEPLVWAIPRPLGSNGNKY